MLHACALLLILGLSTPTLALEQNPHFINRWNYYKETVLNWSFAIQPACVPQYYPAVPPFRGTAVLFHGFSACPDQYETLGLLLSRRGYDVIAPLTPGMGGDHTKVGPVAGRCVGRTYWNEPDACGKPLYYVGGLANSTVEIDYFVQLIAYIMESARGERVAAGLSMGGALALRSAGFIPYDRVFVGSAALGQHWMKASFLSILKVTSSTAWYGFGEQVRKDLKAGRGGIGTFQVRQLAAMADFGYNVAQNYEPASQSTNFQFITVNEDTAVPNPVTYAMAGKLSKASIPVQSCVMDLKDEDGKPVHSFIAPADGIDSNRYWTGHVYCTLLAYLADGVAYPVENRTVQGENNWPVCKQICNITTCKHYWQQSKKAFEPPLPECMDLRKVSRIIKS